MNNREKILKEIEFRDMEQEEVIDLLQEEAKVKLADIFIEDNQNE